MVKHLYNHILVPTDFRPGSREAYRTAFALALGSNARVTLLHVRPPREQDEYRGLDALRLLHLAADRQWANIGYRYDDTPQALAACLRQLQAEVHPEWAGAIDLRTEVRSGDVAAEIARYARENEVDLIVTVGTRPSLLRVFRSRMADRVARLTPVKVLRITPPVPNRTPAVEIG